MGGYSIDLFESGLTTKFFRGFVSLAFSLLVSGVVTTRPLRCSRTIGWETPLPIAGLWAGGANRDDPTSQTVPVVLSAIESYLATFLTGGGYIPSPEQAVRLTKFLNA